MKRNPIGLHVLSHDTYFPPPDFPGVPRFSINDQAALYLIPNGLQVNLNGLKFHGMFHGVPRVSLPPIQVHSADTAASLNGSVAAATAPLGVVQQIVDAASQASWFSLFVICPAIVT